MSWRKKELIDFYAMAQLGSGARQGSLCRAGVVLLYAHWEGFIKESASLYLAYTSYNIKQRSMSFDKLSPHFAALALGSSLTVHSDASIVPFLSRASKMLSQPSQVPELFSWSLLRTDSNLSSVVLRKLLLTLQFDVSVFELRSRLIDERLLAPRNRIAHGDRFPVTIDDYGSTQTAVLELLDIFRNQIENAVAADVHVLKPGRAEGKL